MSGDDDGNHPSHSVSRQNSEPIHHDNPDETERIRRQTIQYDKLLAQAVSGEIAANTFVNRMRDLGASAIETQEYFQQLEDILDKQGPTGNGGEPGNHRSRSGTPEGLEGDALEEFRRMRDERDAERHRREQQEQFEAAEAIAWKLLETKASKRNTERSRSVLHPLAKLDALLDSLKSKQDLPTSSSRSIPASVLAGAPHLANLTLDNIGDPHIAETWRLRQLYTTEKAMEPLIDAMQANHAVHDAFPRPIWKLIIQDLYVDFVKLHAALDSETRFSHIDEAKPFAGNFLLISQDQLSKKPIRSEGDWSRVYNVWEAAVVALFPHRKDELAAYRRIIDELFRLGGGNPFVAIDVDREVRLQYGKKPFRLDDRSIITPFTMAGIYREHHTSSGQKRSNPFDGMGAPSLKRSSTVCYNWNYGFCSDPCEFGRVHGVCSECREQHRAKDRKACITALKARHGKGGSGNEPEGSGSRDRA